MPSTESRIRWRDAFYDAELSSNAKAVGWALFQRLPDSGGMNCYPGQERIARDTGLSVSSVSRGTKELVDAGWIEREERRTDEGHKSYLYTLIPPTSDSTGYTHDASTLLLLTYRWLFFDLPMMTDLSGRDLDETVDAPMAKRAVDELGLLVDGAVALKATLSKVAGLDVQPVARLSTGSRPTHVRPRVRLPDGRMTGGGE